MPVIRKQKFEAETDIMKVKFWGARGSIPTPHGESAIRDKLTRALQRATPADIVSDEAISRFIDSLPMAVRGAYGGNSTCLQVKPGNGETIIIDCGTGIRDLGRELMSGPFGKGQGIGNILMTHTHWDHVQGIPFFVPFYVPGNRFTFYSPFKDMKERIEYQQVFTHFPVNLDYMRAAKEFVTLEKEGAFFLNGVKIMTKRMRHPGGSFGYRIEDGDRVFVFTSDCEFNIDEIESIDQYQFFFENADILVFDTQYTFEESINKIDWGHSSASIAIDIAARFHAKKLVLFHHDPEYSDDKLDLVLANAKSYVAMNLKRKHLDLEVELAIEGKELEV
jgi:phosphoribosyl 1,2-cyclic phosphodiesterase